MKKRWNSDMVVGVVGSLQVVYVSSASDKWAEQLPDNNWILFAIADIATQVPANAVVACVRRNPAGICCTGEYAAALEDCFDIAIAVQVVDWEVRHVGNGHSTAMLVTTSDSNIQEALHYAVAMAPSLCEEVINTVVCVDFTHRHQSQIRELVSQLAAG